MLKDIGKEKKWIITFSNGYCIGQNVTDVQTKKFMKNFVKKLELGLDKSPKV